MKMLFIDTIRAMRSKFAENCNALTRARLNERHRVEEQLTAKHSAEVARLERKHQMEINDKDAEINSLNEHVKSLQGIVLGVSEVYEESLRAFNTGHRLANDVKQSSDNLLTVMGQYYQQIAAVQEQARVEQKALEAGAPRMREKLRQRELKV